ncbi:MAG TPA: T9SS type A sorting domain-containing protein, partial [Candidatus Syntrophosphaera sp.]|nr:T9SS type A sorting domain-containing protein [Candidatus Syntrophosphaera sp.]
ITSMKGAYPNPFKANTNIEVSLKAGESGSVTIYNVLGQVVRTFNVEQGTHTIQWDGMNSKGDTCGSGIYFYKLATPSVNQTKKMVIVK